MWGGADAYLMSSAFKCSIFKPPVTLPGHLAAELLFNCSFCLCSEGLCERTEGNLEKGVPESSTESWALLFASEGFGGGF